MTAEARHIAVAAAALDDRLACRRRILDALTEIIQLDADRELRVVATRRYLDLTNPDLKEIDP